MKSVSPTDVVFLLIGIVLMAFAQWPMWELRNEDGVYALGLGMALPSLWKTLKAMLLKKRDQ